MININRSNKIHSPISSHLANESIDKTSSKEDMWTVFRVTVLSKEGILPFLLTLAYMIAHFLTTGKSSVHFKVKALHEQNKLVGIWAKHHFKDSVVGSAANIAKKHTIDNEEDLDAAESLKNICQLVIDAKLQESGITTKIKNDSLTGSFTNGICWGIRLDIAKRLLEGNAIQDVIEENQFGAPANAAANQEIYEKVNIQMSIRCFNALIYASAEEIGRSRRKSENPLFLVDFNQVRKLHEEFRDLNDHTENAVKLVSTYKEILLLKINKKFDQLVKDPTKLGEALIEREKELLNLRWAVGIMQLELGNESWSLDCIEDPEMRFVLGILREKVAAYEKEKIVMEVRGMRLKSTTEQIGDSSQFPNDRSYLEKINELEPGIYAVDFITGKGAHAITFYKESDDSSFILDPNNFVLHCNRQNEKNPAEELAKLIALYEETRSYQDDPLARGPFYKENDPFHGIEIQKIEIQT